MSAPIEFPLYDALAERAQSERPPDTVWSYMMNLPIEQTEIVFALIWHYAMLHNQLPVQIKNSKKFILPYQGKLFEGGKGMVFRLEDLPAGLKTILGLYISSAIQV